MLLQTASDKKVLLTHPRLPFPAKPAEAMLSFPLFRLCVVVFGCLLMRASGQAATAQPGAPAPANLPAIEHQALAFMSDIALHGPITGTPTKVSYATDHAFWGTFFGDNQLAALVAVDLARGKDHTPGDNADLCLLWWEDGWKFRQWVGKVSATVSDNEPQWDWAVKHREPAGAWYVVSHLNSYPAGEHLSWRCDPKTHTLHPTGWPKDAVPSMAGDTITFTHQDRPGYSSPIRDIYRFTDHPAEHIATRGNNLVEGDVLTLWNENPDKVCTWQVHETILQNLTTQYAISRAEGKQAAQQFREDAAVKFEWNQGEYPVSPIEFLWRRVSGLSDNALRGEWDQDGRPDAKPPRRVTVTGLSEAVQRFSWPVE